MTDERSQLEQIEPGFYISLVIVTFYTITILKR